MLNDVLAWLSGTGLAHHLQVAAFTLLQQLGIMSGNAARYATRTISWVDEAQVYDGHNYGPQIPDADTLQAVVVLLFLAVALLVTGLLVAGRYVYKRKIKSVLVSLLQRVSSAFPPTAAHQSAVDRVKQLSTVNDTLSRDLHDLQVNNAHVAFLRTADQRKIDTLAARVCALTICAGKLKETNVTLDRQLGARDKALEDVQLAKERTVKQRCQAVYALAASRALVKLEKSKGKAKLARAVSARSAAEKEAQEAWTMAEERSSELEALAEESRKLQRQAAEREQSLQRDVSQAQHASRALSVQLEEAEDKSSAVNERLAEQREVNDTLRVKLAAVESSLAEEKQAHTRACEARDAELASLRAEVAGFKKAALLARSELNVRDNSFRQLENAHSADLVALRRTHVHELNERDTSLRQLKDKHAVDVAALERAHAQECEPLRAELASYKNAALLARSELNVRDNTIRQLVTTHAADLVALRRTHGHECEQLRKNTAVVVYQLERKHADELVELRSVQHDKERVIEELGENVQAFAVSLAVVKLAESEGKAKLARAVSEAQEASAMVEERDRRLAAWADEWRKAQRKEIKNDKALQLALNRARYMSHTLEFRLEDAHHEANAVNERVVKQSKTIKALRVKLAVAKSDLAEKRRRTGDAG